MSYARKKQKLNISTPVGLGLGLDAIGKQCHKAVGKLKHVLSKISSACNTSNQECSNAHRIAEPNGACRHLLPREGMCSS
jgi:hypothetical protein